MRSLALTYAEILVGSYYQRFRWGGEVPQTGGLVIYTNHSNGLVDGQLSLFLTKRQVSILAKASLFKIPVLQWLIRQIGAIPIYRQKDKVDMARNEDSFREVHDRLLEGGALVIYPEGESLLGYRIRPFRTGAARMGLGALAKALDLKAGTPSENPQTSTVRFVPILFVYEEQEVFRSRAHLWVGEPFDASAWAQDYREDERETVRAVTQILKEHLETLCIPVDERSDFDFLVQMDRLLSAEPDGAPQRLQALANPWQSIQSIAPDPAADLRKRLMLWVDQANALGLEGYDITQSALHRTGSGRLRAFASLLVTIVLLPFWLPPILLSRVIARIGCSTPDKLVTVTVLTSSALVTLWLIALTLWSSQFTSGWIAFGVWMLWGTLALLWIRRAGRPRPLRRACTLLGLQGSAQKVDSLWIEKQSLCQDWRTLLRDASVGKESLADTSHQDSR